MSSPGRLIVTPGDPLGIGPEVAVKAIVQGNFEALLVGDGAAIRAEALKHGLKLKEVGRPDREGVSLLDTSGGQEPAEVAAIRLSVHWLLAHPGALATGPIHKARLARQGFRHPGHTEFLGELCGVDSPVMAFVGGRLMVSLVTVHLPLREVAGALTMEGVLRTIRLSARALQGHFPKRVGRVAVCGLNPHAGDGGLLGDEEQRVIGPAVEQAQSEGWNVVGPISAETAFRKAALGEVDWVVAMYHDQGLAPLKLVDFGKSVNWTLGLPMVRTSVDHGTADDIAGKGIADPSSMIAAIEWANQLIR